MENVTIVNVKNKDATQATVSLPGMFPPKPKMLESASQPTLAVKFLSAGIAACIADMITFPLDTAKVRLQIQGEGTISTTGSTSKGAHASQSGALGAQASRGIAISSSSNVPKYKGIIGTVRTISVHEGPRALYNGLVPGLQRQMCFASVRIGLYDAVKQSYVNFFQAHGLAGSGAGFGLRIAAGITTGATAVLCAQPTDVVKVRMQAQRGNAPKRYPGVFSAYAIIAKEEGVKGLWKGASPNITRNAVVNCTELVSYDLIKEKILSKGLMSDNMPCHFVCGTGAGFITTIIASPVDVVKTRFMNSGAGTYTGVLNCAITMFKKEGFKAFYKGFAPSFARLASWNIVMFVCYEQLKKGMTNPGTPKIPSIELQAEPKRYI